MAGGREMRHNVFCTFKPHQGWVWGDVLPEPESWVILTYLMWVLGTKLASSEE